MIPLVEVRAVAKQFGNVLVFENVSFDVHAGAHLALIGESEQHRDGRFAVADGRL